MSKFINTKLNSDSDSQSSDTDSEPSYSESLDSDLGNVFFEGAI